MPVRRAPNTSSPNGFAAANGAMTGKPQSE
jgi:hypothetical protein